MLVQEMHNGIDLELNKINSNLYDILLSQEKDYFLNRAQDRKIKQYYNPTSNNKKLGFEMSQKRIDDLKNLLIPNYYDKALRVDVSDFDYESKLRFYFPDDYMFLTSQRSKVYFNGCSTITSNNSTETKNYFILSIPTNIESYTDFELQNAASTTLISNLDITNMEQSLFVEYVVNYFNANLSSLGWKFYNGSYRDISSQGNIIAVATVVSPNILKYTFDSINFTSFSTIAKNYTYLIGSNGAEKVHVNRFAQQDDVYTMQEDPFNKTNPYEPLTIIHNNSIDIFIEKNDFIVKEVGISYIRKPKMISLTMNQSCELSEEMHEEIVRDAVNLILEGFQADQRLATSLQVEDTNE